MGLNSADITAEAVRRQIGAMGAGVFEVGLYRPDLNDTRSPTMLPRTWDAETLMKSVPWMRLQNLSGRNVYVRPKGEHNLSLVDDLSAEAVARMKKSGFRPALLVETSPGNLQAWLKHSHVLPKELSTAAARRLAADFGGDRGAADWRHFGRLAGFTNRKEKHRQANGQYPFVRVVEASGVVYPEAAGFIASVKKDLERAESVRHEAAARARAAQGRPAGPLKTIDAFRSNPLYGGDGTRIDLAYAIYALAHGVDDAAVGAAIRTRDLSHKGNEKRQTEYVTRTVKKALLTLEKSRGRGR